MVIVVVVVAAVIAAAAEEDKNIVSTPNFVGMSSFSIDTPINCKSASDQKPVI